MACILVVDDSRSALDVTGSILSEAGHRAITSTSARGALQMLQSQAVDILITDIYMPDEDGLELIREMRRVSPHTPIVAMSGLAGERDMLPVAQLLGACHVLRKPFSRAELLHAVVSASAKLPHQPIPR